METNDLIAVGEVIKTHGVRGEVVVIPLTDHPQKRFGQIQRVFWKTGDGIKELFIEKFRICKNAVYVKFTGIDDLNAALLLGRGLLYIPKNERPKLPTGRYYEDEIIGLEVIDNSGGELGTISRIYRTGANDVYEVTHPARTFMIPALKQVIKNIDLTTGKMVVELPPGLLEEEEA